MSLVIVLQELPKHLQSVLLFRSHFFAMTFSRKKSINVRTFVIPPDRNISFSCEDPSIYTSRVNNSANRKKSPLDIGNFSSCNLTTPSSNFLRIMKISYRWSWDWPAISFFIPECGDGFMSRNMPVCRI